MASDEDTSSGMYAGGGDQTEGSPSLQWVVATAALREALEPSIAAAAKTILPADLGVHLVDVSVWSYSRFRRGVQEPTCCYAMVARRVGAEQDANEPLPGTTQVEFSPEIASPVIDMLLGGRGESLPPKAGPLTTIERRVLRRMAALVAGCLSREMGRVSPWVLEVAPEDQPSQAQAASDDPAVTVLTFRLTCRGASGTMRLCLDGKLLAAVIPAVGRKGGVVAGVELTAALPDAHLPADQAAGLAEGDIVVTDTPADGEVVVRLAGVAKFAGRLGSCSGRRAVTITRRLDGQQPPRQP